MKLNISKNIIQLIFLSLKDYWDGSTDNRVLRDKYKGGAVVARTVLGDNIVNHWEETDFQEFTLTNL